MNQINGKQTNGDSRRAFSVIGLMIVVAVIGIVVALALPAQMRSQQISHARACQENLARISGASEAYALQNSLGGTSTVNLDDLVQTTGTGFLQKLPQCPAGGTYSITHISAGPQCSIGKNPAEPQAPHLRNIPIPHVSP